MSFSLELKLNNNVTIDEHKSTVVTILIPLKTSRKNKTKHQHKFSYACLMYVLDMSRAERESEEASHVISVAIINPLFFFRMFPSHIKGSYVFTPSTMTLA